MSLLGIEATPSDYYTIRYVGADSGSTPAELMKLLEKNHCNAVPMVNLSKLDLISLGLPVIASVKLQHAAEYDHWVCVRWTDGSLFVFDGAGDALELTTAEFLDIWNGYGIVVSREYEPIASLVVLQRLFVVMLFVMAGYGITYVLREHFGVRKSNISCIGAVSLVLTLAGNLVFGDLSAVARRMQSVGSLVNAEFSHVGPEAFHEGDRLLVDSRYRSTHEQGAVSGSINVPVDMSDLDLQGLFRGVDRNLPILIYCHSRSCEFDEIMAFKFRGIGFTDIVICDSGWVEYQAMSSTDSAPSAAQNQ